MARSKTSKAWLREHVNDLYVQRANKEGYRSRAAYKLMEMAERDHLLKPGMVVVDLGATPGGWSQVAGEQVRPGGEVIALDLLAMEALPGVTFIQGDFREDAVLAQLQQVLGGRSVGLVLSDMSPNVSGVESVDQARIMHLAELALEFSRAHLQPGGCFLVKVFQGAGFEGFLKEMRASFKQVATRKPKASRGRSKEIYLLGKELLAVA
ncbi:MAG: RlmE family RNA methyltransferase [Pseudomonadota bacterium]